MSGDDNVVSFDANRSRGDRPPPLSDAELTQLRTLLKQFALIAHSCPMARRLIEGDIEVRA